MARTIIVGDVHGCLDELSDLLKKLKIASSDRVYFVGDLIARGPKSKGVIALVKKMGGVSARGNHEAKLLTAYTPTGKNGKELDLSVLGKMHREIGEQLDKASWKWLSETPLWIDLPEHGVRIVHAGVHPYIPLEQNQADIMLRIRGVQNNGVASFAREADPWARVYWGPPHIIFGHHALPEPQLYQWATGIDTGCVYGGGLTAMVLSEGQSVPSANARRAVLVTVPSRRVYAPIGRKKVDSEDKI
jgi:hypothetical protein